MICFHGIPSANANAHENADKSVSFKNIKKYTKKCIFKEKNTN